MVDFFRRISEPEQEGCDLLTGSTQSLQGGIMSSNSTAQEERFPPYKSLYDQIKEGEVKVFFNGRPPSPPEYRFWACVDKNGPLISEILGHCWFWTGCRNRRGYGSLWVDGKNILAHRFSYLLNRGSIPDTMSVLHKCDHPPCVNPAHLWLGTHQDNMRDMRSKGRYPQQLNNRKSKLLDTQVMDILRTCIPGDPEYGQRALARKYGVNCGLICLIWQGRYRPHIYDIWLAEGCPSIHPRGQK
jgi:hypothetical protein